jgi:hypothetical protein
VLVSLDASGQPVFRQAVPLQVPTADGSSLFLDDLEDLAFDGNKTYFAVTSHRQFSDKAEHRRLARSGGTERAVIAFELEKAEGKIRVVNARIVCRDLLDRLRKLRAFETVNFRHSKIFAWRHLATSWQVDIEGLAYVDGELLLGFKNPVEEGKAAILCLNPNTGETDMCGRYDFAGQGIHSLTYDPKTDRLLAVTNDPFKECVGDSCLWIAHRADAGAKWKFPAQPNVILERGSEGLGRKASGITLAGDRLLVCFDDPQRPVIRTFPNP